MRTQFICFALVIILFRPLGSAQWIQTNSPQHVYCFAVNGANIFAGTPNGAFLSTDSGTNWTPVNSGLRDTSIRFLAVSGTNLFAGTATGIFLSTDNGTSWTAVDTGFINTSVFALVPSGTNLFAQTSKGVFRSTDKGISWTAVNSGLTDTLVYALVARETSLFAGTPDGVFLSTNFGSNWNRVNSGLTDTLVTALFVTETNLFATVGHWEIGGGEASLVSSGVFKSSNNGTSWTLVKSIFTEFNAMVASGTSLFACAPEGVFLSTDYGSHWDLVNSSLYDKTGLAVGGTNLFVTTSSHGVWRRPLSEMITSAESPISQTPTAFELHQNYPNPFNPTTTIKFELPKASQVKLTVNDILGREVSVLVNERRDAGVHEVKFDGSNLASGVYFYRLHAGDFTQTKRLLLLK